jgi:hypothetical protein
MDVAVGRLLGADTAGRFEAVNVHRVTRRSGDHFSYEGSGRSMNGSEGIKLARAEIVAFLDMAARAGYGPKKNVGKGSTRGTDASPAGLRHPN